MNPRNEIIAKVALPLRNAFPRQHLRVAIGCTACAQLLQTISKRRRPTGRHKLRFAPSPHAACDVKMAGETSSAPARDALEVGLSAAPFESRRQAKRAGPRRGGGRAKYACFVVPVAAATASSSRNVRQQPPTAKTLQNLLAKDSRAVLKNTGPAAESPIRSADLDARRGSVRTAATRSEAVITVASYVAIRTGARSRESRIILWGGAKYLFSPQRQ
ncbi:hypothetical protein HPB50_002703 [Hyalomma asiaticum]|uniref:Uncharacterized protein n=1 Tax=Hyalomma asiaticum TaxID=266040 RepID=A0ACB7TBC9_HYAAI|nr:hypothetical protein HPB50_002703 [Hyalomma asiaticum]